MPQIKWGGAEEPTINNFFEIESRSVLGDSYGPLAETHVKWGKIRKRHQH